ncbi:hypothetical protein V2H26_11205 [Xanthomonas euvesicatoria]|uniref:hypothetical protein n=1 Tax=Xanthomonas citri TaxID=346 RepID=UPI000F800A30|nr:hypothetical protein [Xanthomonas axonopodis]MEE5090608.1 hypothetical protein [Xanthomonas euvesicatoria]RTE58628.1 hypothetical protein EI541_07430 [Xanthomonas axonopodis pv. eucalyptorum]
MNQAQARARLRRYGITIQQTDERPGHRWVTFPIETPQQRCHFKTLKQAISHWDFVACSCVFDYEMARRATLQANTLDALSQQAFIAWVNGELALLPNHILDMGEGTHLPSDWRARAAMLARHFGSVAEINIEVLLKLAISELGCFAPSSSIPKEVNHHDLAKPGDVCASSCTPSSEGGRH